jgi:hypothetical protein
MFRRNALLTTSALLLGMLAACRYNPTIQANGLECRDSNGCPPGYRCVGATSATPGLPLLMRRRQRLPAKPCRETRA